MRDMISLRNHHQVHWTMEEILVTKTEKMFQTVSTNHFVKGEFMRKKSAKMPDRDRY